ncbi:AAA family ATPase [Deinococcus sp. SDU3-2]|uniref:AAA family ATPase n=1 Tax=Deinococcus terrestris TaxID=2651870 RepID=A0A7X1NYC2_9DEIO|nr:AAA family ATPase [Deinococcus terrestris]MPY68032.1 AAA family ATPase [Deinococcus terrestris]
MSTPIPCSRLLILIGGVSGVGKSHTAHALGRTLNAHLLSTDVLRAAMRSLIPAIALPHLHHSSFASCSDTGDPDLLATMDQQAQALAPALQAAVERALSEHRTVVVEGVHLLPNETLRFRGTRVLRVLLTAPSDRVHHARFVQRAADTGGRRPSGPATAHLSALREMEAALVTRARGTDVLILPSDGATHRALCRLAFEHRYGVAAGPCPLSQAPHLAPGARIGA